MSARRVFAGSHGASHLTAELGAARTQFAALCAAFGADAMAHAHRPAQVDAGLHPRALHPRRLQQPVSRRARCDAAVVTVTSGDYGNWLGVPINWQLIGSDILVTVTMVTKYLSNWKSKS